MTKIIICDYFATEPMLYFAKCHYSCPKLYILSFKKKSRSFPQCFDLFPSSTERTGHTKNESFASLALNHPCFAERTDNLLPKSFEPCSHASRREQDSNLRTGFAGYTLSRRASSTTRAPLLIVFMIATQWASHCLRMQR